MVNSSVCNILVSLYLSNNLHKTKSTSRAGEFSTVCVTASFANSNNYFIVYFYIILSSC